MHDEHAAAYNGRNFLMESGNYKVPPMPKEPRTEHPQAHFSQIGLNVKARRAALGLTQDELGERAGLPPGHVALIEQGRRIKLTGGTLKKLAEGLEWTMEALMSEKTVREPGRQQLEEFIRSRKIAKPEAEAMRELRQTLGDRPSEMVLMRLWDLVREKLRT